MSEWKQYRRKNTTTARAYRPGETLPQEVSISEADSLAGSPKAGDLIAVNPDNPDDKWLIAKAYADKHLELLDGETTRTIRNWTVSENRADRDDAKPTVPNAPTSGEIVDAASLRRCGQALYVEHVDGYQCRVPLKVLRALFG